MVRANAWLGLGVAMVMGCGGESTPSGGDAGTNPGLDAGVTQETCNGRDDDGDSLVDEGMVTLRFSSLESTRYLGDGLEFGYGFDLEVQPGVATVQFGDSRGSEARLEFDAEGRLTRRTFSFEGELRTTRDFVHGAGGLVQETNGTVVRTLVYEGGLLKRATLVDGIAVLASSEVTLSGGNITQEAVDFLDAQGAAGVDGVVDERRTFTYSGGKLMQAELDDSDPQGARGPDGIAEARSVLTWSDGPGPDMIEADSTNGGVAGTDGEVDQRTVFTYAEGRLVKVETDSRPDALTPPDGVPDTSSEITWTDAGNLASIQTGTPVTVTFTCLP